MCRTSCLRECLWCMLRVLCCSAVAALSLRPVTCRCCLYLQWTVLGPWPEWGKFLSRRGKRHLMLVPLELKSCTTQWSVHVGCGGCVLVFWGRGPLHWLLCTEAVPAECRGAGLGVSRSGIHCVGTVLFTEVAYGGGGGTEMGPSQARCFWREEFMLMLSGKSPPRRVNNFPSCV